MRHITPHLWFDREAVEAAQFYSSTLPESQLFSERYGWTEDRYGLSWQIMHVGDEGVTQRITPALMFVGEVWGKAEDAVTFYTSACRGSSPSCTTQHTGGRWGRRPSRHARHSRDALQPRIAAADR